jgi:hypothetical protein
MRRAVAAIALAGCMPVTVPPPTVPEPVLPQMVAAAPPPPLPGQGQVTIATVDDADEPALVEEVTGHYEGTASDGSAVDGLTFGMVCAATPCQVNLPVGDHLLRFTSLVDPQNGGAATITAGAQPSAYRYALGRTTGPTYVGATIAAFTVGTAATTLGFLMVGLGKQTDVPNSCFAMEGPNCAGPFPTTNYTTAGAITAVAGLALTALGVYWVSKHFAGSVQPGAGVQWTPGA